MDIQRLRNLTTGRLHTKMEDIYRDIEFLTGSEGILTHQIPNACRAMEPWLKGRVADLRFWEDKYDEKHVGNFEIAPMTEDERINFWERYGKLPNPLAGKKVITVKA